MRKFTYQAGHIFRTYDQLMHFIAGNTEPVKEQICDIRTTENVI